jgi:D-arabinose 1-dehydrogenase-like Zn-dependent alcohol dehydrogenase
LDSLFSGYGTAFLDGQSSIVRVIQIDRYGGPEVFIRRELPVPSPGPDEVLIRLAYSGVNLMDIHTREGKYARSRTYPQTLPTTLGIEGAGTIEVVGSRVDDFRVGDRVAYCLSWGSYADYAAVAAWRVVHVPEALPLELAAASMFHGLTAHYLAHDVGKLGPGVTCLVHSASGGIGQLLVSAARECDDVFFDATRKRIYVIGGEGIISVFQQNDPDHYELVANVPSAVGIRAGFFFAKRDRFYVAVPAKGNEPAQVWTVEAED